MIYHLNLVILRDMSYFATVYNFGHIVRDSDWNYKVPGSVFCRMYLPTSGEAWVSIYGKVYRLSPGHLYLIPAFTPHENILDGKFGHYYFHFLITSPAVIPVLDRYQLPFEVKAPPLSMGIFTRLAELMPGFSLENHTPWLYEKTDNYSRWSHRYESLSDAIRMEVEGYLSSLLGLFAAKGEECYKDIHPAVEAGKRFIDANYGLPLRIDRIAEKVNMRPETFSRLFQRYTGRTPHDYLTIRRINAAKALLKLTTLSIKQIAIKCGFGDSSYFCLTFRRHEGMTPGQYRTHI